MIGSWRIYVFGQEGSDDRERPDRRHREEEGADSAAGSCETIKIMEEAPSCGRWIVAK